MQIEMKASTLLALVTTVAVLAGIGMGTVISTVAQCLGG